MQYGTNPLATRPRQLDVKGSFDALLSLDWVRAGLMSSVSEPWLYHSQPSDSHFVPARSPRTGEKGASEAAAHWQDPMAKWARCSLP